MRWAEHMAHMGEERNAYRVLVRKSERKRPPGRPKKLWVDEIKINFKWDVFGLDSSVRIGTSSGFF
jgi:hypothetical protein